MHVRNPQRSRKNFQIFKKMPLFKLKYHLASQYMIYANLSLNPATSHEQLVSCIFFPCYLLQSGPLLQLLSRKYPKLLHFPPIFLSSFLLFFLQLSCHTFFMFYLLVLIQNYSCIYTQASVFSGAGPEPGSFLGKNIHLIIDYYRSYMNTYCLCFGVLVSSLSFEYWPFHSPKLLLNTFIVFLIVSTLLLFISL